MQILATLVREFLFLSARALGSVSSRERLDAPAILATFTAWRKGLVACPWRHYNLIIMQTIHTSIA